MKKKILLISLVFICAAGSAWAGSIDFQLGGGYNGVFLGDDGDPDSFPLGFSFFGGVGYKFFPTLSIGAEYEYGHAWSFDNGPLGDTLSLSEHLPKAYLKVNLLNMMTLSALAGADIQTYRADGDKITDETAFAAGVRAAVLFGYVQYMAVFNEDRTDQRLGVGVILNK
jgi:hypothetical protein